MYHLQHLAIFYCLLAAFISIGSFAGSAYAAGGDPVWQYDHVLANDQQAQAVVVDPAGYIIITGYSLNTTEDFVTLKVKADGTGKLWDSVYDYNNDNTSNDRAIAAAVDSNGDIIVTGQVNNGVNTDIHTIKYNGTTGVVIWQNTYNGTNNGHEYPFAIAVDDLDNVFVAGKTQNGSGDFDGLVLKYSPIGPNPDGSPIWDVTYDGSAGGQNDEWANVAAKAGAIAVTGTTHNGTDIDIVTLKYNLDSTEAWAGGPVIHDGGS
ncbi:MAG: hypothetical protein KAJ06_08995, partial [Gammaproteobacteria bacterium]|nr:hypothetical protein [Gammaproteobacteria bacterium]